MTDAFNRPSTKLAAQMCGITLQDGHCPLCQKPVNPSDFRDSLSLREYGISGICQTCQDSVFAPSPHEEDGL